jgi:hypothetical protein
LTEFVVQAVECNVRSLLGNTVQSCNLGLRQAAKEKDKLPLRRIESFAERRSIEFYVFSASPMNRLKHLWNYFMRDVVENPIREGFNSETIAKSGTVRLTQILPNILNARCVCRSYQIVSFLDGVFSCWRPNSLSSTKRHE